MARRHKPGFANPKISCGLFWDQQFRVIKASRIGRVHISKHVNLHSVLNGDLPRSRLEIRGVFLGGHSWRAVPK